jgi:hypothetical protein
MNLGPQLIWIVPLLAPAAGVFLHLLTEGRRSLRRNMLVALAYYASLGLSYGLMALVLRREIWQLQMISCGLVIFGPVLGFGIALSPAVERSHKIRGTCRVCGYNLTGNVSGRCPECGTTVDWSKQ